MLRKWCIFGLIILGLLFCQNVFAEAVFLKNGSIMIGKVVGGDKESIFLKTGNPESPVVTTIFLTDIIRIMSDEEYTKSLIRISPKTFEVEREMPWENKQSILSTNKLTSAPDHIKTMIENNRLATQQALAEEKEINPEDIIQPEPFFAGRSKVKKGDGSVSGCVRLPDLLKNKRGDLYVYLMEQIGKDRYASGSNLLFQKIPADKIGSRKVEFSIDHVPEGTYKVFAEWDVEPPPIQIRDSAEGGKGLGYLGFKGDYQGSTEDVIALKEDEHYQTVDFNCMTYIWNNEAHFDQQEKPSFAITDLYFQKLPGLPNKIMMTIKNESDYPIYFLAVDVYINNVKITSFPMDLGVLGANREKDIEITGTFFVYAKLVQESAPEALSKPLLFKITWPSTGEVLLEKTTPAFNR